MKPDVKPKPGGKVVNPSERLALLLRKESMLAVKVRKAQDELRAAQQEISTLWEERQELNRELVGGEV
jgi:hypothetical protein